MKETLNPSAERNVMLPESLENFRDVLDICKECSELSDLIVMPDEEIFKGRNSLSGKLRILGNKYQTMFDFYATRNPSSEEEFNEWYTNTRNFLVELSNLVAEVVVPGTKGKNPIVDGFVKKVFRLNDAFHRLNIDVKNQKNAAYYVNDGLYEDDYSSKFNISEMYNYIIKDFDALMEDNKKLGIFMYRSLLNLMDKELESLLGPLGENRIPTEEEFVEMLNNLFIADFLSERKYEDFCNKYDILKGKQKDLHRKKEFVEKYFDEDGNLRADAKFRSLHMGKLRNYLKVYRMDVVKQYYKMIIKALGKKNK